MSTNKSFHWVAALALASCVTTVGFTQSASGKTLTDQAAKARGDAMEGLKRLDAKNDPDKVPEAPPNKGGQKSRGILSGIKIDNITGYYIKIYIDDNYEGTVSPWGDLFTITASGRTKFYAVAEFTDGSYSTWGPRVDTINGVFTWKLTR